MKPQIVIVLLVVGLVAVLGVAFYTGVVSFPSESGFGSDGVFSNILGDDPLDPDELPDDSEESSDTSIDTLSLTDREILQALEYLTGKNLPEGTTMPYISSLHMQAYGVNGITAHDLLNYYEDKNSNEGYTSYTTFVDTHPGYTSYNEVWYQGLSGRGVSTADGASITSFYGYGTMCLTSYGPLTEYQDLWVIIDAAPPL